MLDLEERLTRHYTDVATAPSLHRRSSAAPRLAFAGLVLALIAGAAYVSGFGSTDETIIAAPSPAETIETGTIDPELLRLLERTPYLEDSGIFGYVDLEVARQGEVFESGAEDGDPVMLPRALEWGLPVDPGELIAARQFPTPYEDAFGYGFDDITGVLDSGFAGSFDAHTTFVVIDGDASAALDRATAPEWAAQDTRTQEGPFDIRDWGDLPKVPLTSPTPSSNVRPLGEAGQLTAFDGNVTFQSESRELLEMVMATRTGAPALADQEQLMGGLQRLDYNDLLGMFVIVVPDGYLNTGLEGDATQTGPTLLITETNLDGSSRVVLGFLPGTDVADVETRLGELIDPTVDVSQYGIGTEAPMATTITRSDEYVVIDFVPNDPTARFGPNDEVMTFVRNLIIENPDLLS